MNKKGFTLVELLATIVVLSIVVGLTIVGINANIRNAKKKTEEVFIGTLRDAIKIYLDDDSAISDFNWQEQLAKINKTTGSGKLSKAGRRLSFNDIISSSYSPIAKEDLLNPANEKMCDYNQAVIDIYKDSEEVYYYYINKYWVTVEGDSNSSCFLESDVNYISNLPGDVISSIYGE